MAKWLQEVSARQPGAWALESLWWGLRFFCTFEKSGKNESTDLAVSQLQNSTIAIISAHVPGPYMWASAGPDPSSSSPKQCKSDDRVEIYNSVSARSPLTKSKKEKIRAQQYKKRACQCSAMQNWLGAAERISTLQKIESMLPDTLQPVLTTKSLIRFNLQGKTAYDSSYFATCNWFFGIQDCRTQIFQLEYQGQTRNTRILERKPLIDTSYRISHRLELKYFHFAPHQTAHWPRKSENW